MDRYCKAAENSVRQHRSLLVETAGALWDMPEERFQECHSSELLETVLEKEGFRVEKGIGGLPTAFRASFGSGSPVIGFLGEYDALPGLCQTEGTAEKKPIEGKPNIGHGCGHHLLGTALLGAAAALKEYLEAGSMSGTAVYYGCPAEESGSGKVWMMKAHVFDEADALFSWHPDCISRVSLNDVLATVQTEYRFHGTASHAAIAPQAGRSALEAAELMAVGMGFLREHLPSSARVHYAYVNAGGPAVNVIQPETAVTWQVRAPKMSQVKEISARISDLARGAAVMTGTTAEEIFMRSTAELRVNETLNELLYEALAAFGRPQPDEESLDLAERLYATLPASARGMTAEKTAVCYGEEGRILADRFRNQVLLDEIFPRKASGIVYGASSDVGDVSQVKPLGFLNVACYVKDIPLHSWQAVSFGKSGFAMEGMLTAAKVLGAAAVRLAASPEILTKARTECREQNAAEPYVSLIPEDMKPPIVKKP
jgi:aminobenzoyl-glutamate utilization protein B